MTTCKDSSSKHRINSHWLKMNNKNYHRQQYFEWDMSQGAGSGFFKSLYFFMLPMYWRLWLFDVFTHFPTVNVNKSLRLGENFSVVSYFFDHKDSPVIEILSFDDIFSKHWKLWVWSRTFPILELLSLRKFSRVSWNLNWSKNFPC